MNKDQKRLCWARNVVKKWEAKQVKDIGLNGADRPILEAVCAKRYERACALILADRLRKS